MEGWNWSFKIEDRDGRDQFLALSGSARDVGAARPFK